MSELKTVFRIAFFITLIIKILAKITKLFKFILENTIIFSSN